jgi:hypothetical protein
MTEENGKTGNPEAFEDKVFYEARLEQHYVLNQLIDLVLRYGVNPTESKITLGFNGSHEEQPIYIRFLHEAEQENAGKLTQLINSLVKVMQEKGLPVPDDSSEELGELRFFSYKELADVLEEAIGRAPRSPAMRTR